MTIFTGARRSSLVHHNTRENGALRRFFVRPRLRFAAALACVLAVGHDPAEAAPIGRGVVAIDVAGPNSHSCVHSAFTDAAYELAGTPVNLGDPQSPTFVGEMVCSWVAGPLSHCDSSPDPSIMSFDFTSTYICEPDNCQGHASYITTSITNVSGSLAAQLGDVSYSMDGAIDFAGIHQTPDTLPYCTLPAGGYYRFNGTFVVNAFLPVSTASGINVAVQTETGFLNPDTGSSQTIVVDIGFAAVGASGETLVTASSNSSAALASNFAATVDGFQAVFLDISTTAVVAPPITICTDYADADNDGLLDGTSVPETSLRLLHGEGSPVAFVDRTASQDTVANRLCAEVDSLSPFVAAIELCGNGALDGGEQCDDANASPGDGCSVDCDVESGWTCTTPGSPCTFVCGNSQVESSENCDDGNAEPDDGCSAGCRLEPGWQCATPGAPCSFVCGSATLDAGEGCDDGNTAAGDGCSSVCTVEDCFQCSGEPSACAPDNGSACDDGNACTATDTCSDGTCAGAPDNGATCDDANRCTTNDTCQDGGCQGSVTVCESIGACFDAGICNPATGFCSNPPKPEGSCDDGNPCSVADACVSGQCMGSPEPQALCRTAAKSSLSITLGGNASGANHSKDKISFKWSKGAATTYEELGDPSADDGYALCLYDADGAQLSRPVAAGGSCGDQPCWSATAGKGVRYKDKNATVNDGITAIKVQAGEAGKSKAQLAGKGADLALSSALLDLVAPLTVQLKRESGDVCFEGSFDAGDISNDGVKLKASATAP